MTSKYAQWVLFLVPALVIGIFETIRHTLLENVLPMELGNWITAVIDAVVIAIISRSLLQRFSRTERELFEANQSRALFEERERLSKVLHDQIAQSLFYSGVQVNLVKTHVSRYGDKELDVKHSDIFVSLREIDENLRQAIFNLKHNMTDGQRFKERVLSYLERAFEGQHILWTVNIPEQVPLTPSEEVQLFGILQECITNVLKHANASVVEVKFTSSTSENAGLWTLAITDNGSGFSSTSAQGAGFGLDIITSRARDIKCELNIHTNGNGTEIAVKKAGVDHTSKRREH